MPWLDVSDITVDPDFADVFTVIQRPVTVDEHGRAQMQRVENPGIVGTVTLQDPADLMRGDDSDAANRMIFVAAPFRFRSISKEGAQQYKGDIIVWPPVGEAGSTEYTVIKVYPYSRFGAGMFECVAQSMNATDEVL